MTKKLIIAGTVLLPAIQPILDVHIRVAAVIPGGDDYYLAGSPELHYR